MKTFIRVTAVQLLLSTFAWKKSRHSLSPKPTSAAVSNLSQSIDSKRTLSHVCSSATFDGFEDSVP
jgi:hypothetical protein